MQKNPQLDGFLTILSAVQRTVPSAFMAGGALRDTHHGRPVKDLDIFLPEGSDVETIVDDLTNSLSRGRILAVCDFTSCEGMSDCLLSVSVLVEGDNLQETEVNLIVLSGTPAPLQVLERMDFGICQVGTDGRVEYTTPAYVKDSAAKTFTITRNDSSGCLTRTMNRWDRLRQKYEGWTLVNPYL